MSVAEAAKGTQLSALKKHEQGDLYQIAFISKALNELKNLVKCEANADQLITWAELIAARYWYFKAEELLKVLLEGASNKYGKTYGAVTFQTVCEWFDAYEEGKRKHIEDETAQYKESYDHNRGTVTLKDLHEQNKVNGIIRQAKNNKDV